MWRTPKICRALFQLPFTQARTLLRPADRARHEKGKEYEMHVQTCSACAVEIKLAYPERLAVFIFKCIGHYMNKGEAAYLPFYGWEMPDIKPLNKLIRFKRYSKFRSLIDFAFYVNTAS